MEELPLILSLSLVLFGGILLFSSIKIAKAGQRLAIFRFGRFIGLKGPGVIFRIPEMDEYIKISVGDQGVLVAEDEVRMKEKGIPSEIEGSASVGHLVYVKNFRENRIVVDAHFDQTRFVKCEKCGHVNVIR